MLNFDLENLPFYFSPPFTIIKSLKVNIVKFPFGKRFVSVVVWILLIIKISLNSAYHFHLESRERRMD
jgi:hypothetical protein